MHLNSMVYVATRSKPPRFRFYDSVATGPRVIEKKKKKRKLRESKNLKGVVNEVKAYFRRGTRWFFEFFQGVPQQDNQLETRAEKCFESYATIHPDLCLVITVMCLSVHFGGIIPCLSSEVSPSQWFSIFWWSSKKRDTYANEQKCDETRVAM